LHTTKWKY